jgi:heme/copper-type cytochrome/quinol oxidase subunit 1
MTPTEPSAPNQEMENTFTGGYRRNTTINTWKIVSAFLGTILVCGTIISTMGKAFYVTRTEYTEKAQKDAIDQVYLQQTLEQVKKSLNEQQTSFLTLSNTVLELKLELARRR